MLARKYPRNEGAFSFLLTQPACAHTGVGVMMIGDSIHHAPSLHSKSSLRLRNRQPSKRITIERNGETKTHRINHDVHGFECQSTAQIVLTDSCQIVTNQIEHEELGPDVLIEVENSRSALRILRTQRELSRSRRHFDSQFFRFLLIFRGLLVFTAFRLRFHLRFPPIIITHASVNVTCV